MNLRRAATAHAPATPVVRRTALYTEAQQEGFGLAKLEKFHFLRG